MLVGTITQISDGVVQTAGVSVNISKDNGAYVAGANTPTVEQGEWSYTPSQAETDCSSLRIVIYKTGCYSRSIQVVFTASELFGYAGTDQSKIANATSTINLSGTTIKSVTDEVTANAAKIGGQTASAAAPVSFPASVANETTVSNRPTLAQIEGSTVLAKDATVAKESTANSILTAIQNLNNLSAKMNIFGSPLLEIPDAGSTVYAFTVVVKDDEDKLVALDASPTITAANAAGTNRSGNLSAVSNPSTGRYTFTYSVPSTHAAESLRIAVSGAVSGEARYIEWIGAVVDYDTLTILNAIKVKTDNLPANPAAVSDIPTSAANAEAVWTRAGRTLSEFSFQVTVGAYAAGQAPLQTLGANAPAGWINEGAIANNAITGDKIAASAVTKVTVGLFKYGDVQRWNSPANQIDVTITKV